MRYVSTRGRIGYTTFEDALFSGYAADGGLIVPESTPQISVDTLSKWKGLSYPEVVEEVVSLYVTEDEIPRKELKNMLSSAFSRFDIDDVINIVSFKDLNIAELWHGPTMAFKDLSMMCVGEFFNYFLSKRGKHVTIMPATSGDTGSSAIEAVRGQENVDIIVILPYNRISKIQELMMTTVLDNNVHVYAADGFCDDFDITIKSLFADKEFTKKHNLCSINSINWARVMVQIAHHIYKYLQTTDTIGAPIDIVIPTGGCGNVTSGVFARAMGLPVKFVCVVNDNDIVHRIIQRNDFSLASKVIQTFACSMDIQIPANFERTIWVFSGKNGDVTRKVMESFENSGQASLPLKLHEELTKILRSAVVTDNEITKTLTKCWQDHAYVCCPHTCAALAYYYGISKYGTRETSGTKMENGQNVPIVCVSTASIAKFPEILTKTCVGPIEEVKRISELFSKAAKSSFMGKEDDWEEVMRRKIESISSLKMGC